MRFPVQSSGKLSYRIRAVVKDCAAAMLVRECHVHSNAELLAIEEQLHV